MEKENQLASYISAKRPIIYINHYDYKEIDNFIEEATNNISNRKIHEYRAIGEVDFKTKQIAEEKSINLFKFLEAYFKFGIGRNIFLLLKDVDKELEQPEVIALIKKISEMNVYNSDYNCTIIIVSQNIQVPKELENYISVVDIPKLSETELEKYILSVAEKRNITVNEKDLGEIAISLKGLSKWYITQILNMMDSISTLDIQKIIEEKGQIIKKSGILELIDFKEKIEDIGGLENLKDWLENKSQIFRRLDEAKKFGVDTPKGVLLVGMPGCGKSLTAKAASRMFNVPLLRLDIGRLLGKYVGESEHNLRMALEMSESISPCILWIDEIEKAFAGIDQTGGASDITKRLFGQFLTWLQEKENTVFVVATANDISCFPPEFLRKGRFDEIFYVDFPTKEEREEIFRIHLEKRGKYNKDLVDLEKLAGETKDFCGADIEEAVKIAVEECFLDSDKDKNIYTSDLQESIKRIDPMKIILKEKIEALKEAYEKFKLKPASLKEGDIKGLIKKERIRSKDPDMVFVRGGKYKPSFLESERKVCDLFVNKYLVTQDIWKRIMGNYPSRFREDKRPVECILWQEALEFCNRLSEINGLKPVYEIGKNSYYSAKVKYLNGECVELEKADFTQTEGYRLPTEIEWEWFAWGGEIAMQNRTFDKSKIKDRDFFDDKAWSYYNSNHMTQEVGKKKPNELGLYDVIGNVWEMTDDKNFGGSWLIVRGGYYQSDCYDWYKGNLYEFRKEDAVCFFDDERSSTYGFRVVRTANPDNRKTISAKDQRKLLQNIDKLHKK